MTGEIRLGQFLKLADLVDSGADAKTVVADGLVLVGDEVETRRGRQLVTGDVVRHGDRAAVVAAPEEAAPGDLVPDDTDPGVDTGA